MNLIFLIILILQTAPAPSHERARGSIIRGRNAFWKKTRIQRHEKWSDQDVSIPRRILRFSFLPWGKTLFKNHVRILRARATFFLDEDAFSMSIGTSRHTKTSSEVFLKCVFSVVAPLRGAGRTPPAKNPPRKGNRRTFFL